MNSKEKVLGVIVDFKQTHAWAMEDLVYEMKELVAACGAEMVDHTICKLSKPNASSLIGEGKVQEIANAASVMKVDTVVFSSDLKGSQQRNLEEALKVKTIDRTQLILDIFARRAKTQEGKMQVELAQLEYLLPRLVGKGIELSRLGGGIGTSGPGETKLEVDRRRIGERIARLKKDLKATTEDRALKRKRRKEQGIPLVSLVGYTNAGKTSLLNQLTQAGQVANDALFTTLDSLARQYVLPNNQKIIISDTVGFIHDLPHHLVESFKATLEEVVEADLLLHVVDVSHPNFRNLHEAVLKVLYELDATDKDTITVLNKIDKVEDKTWFNDIKASFDDAVCISAQTGENIDELVQKISSKLSSLIMEIEVTIPINRMDLVNLAHKEGQVVSIKYYNDSIHLRVALPNKITHLFYL